MRFRLIRKKSKQNTIATERSNIWLSIIKEKDKPIPTEKRNGYFTGGKFVASVQTQPL